MSHHNCHKDSEGSALVYVFFVPFILITIVFTWLGYALAKDGHRFRAVQLMTLPAWYFTSNFIGAIVVLPGTFLISLFTGNKQIFSWTLSHIGDLLVFPVWGRIFCWFFRVEGVEFSLSIPVGAVLTFQLIVFLGIGYRLSRHLTCTLMDMATSVNARNSGVYPYTARQERLRGDAGYAKAAQYYEKTGKPPLLGFFGVAMAGTVPNDLYHYVR